MVVTDESAKLDIQLEKRLDVFVLDPERRRALEELAPFTFLPVPLGGHLQEVHELPVAEILQAQPALLHPQPDRADPDRQTAKIEIGSGNRILLHDPVRPGQTRKVT